ncbi:MAG: Ku protein [Geminicoccaceae bacterium]
MAPRANWKGFLTVGELTCSVALYTAASTSERIAFNTINRATGHRVHREFVDRETGKPVEREDQVKGYQIGDGDYVVLKPEEIQAVVPASDKTLTVGAFIPCAEIDTVYLDRPYYLAPADRVAEEVFTLIRDGLRAKKVAMLARALLFRRLRTLMIRPHEAGMIASTLNFDYQVRDAADMFRSVPQVTIKGEMLDLAEHIIATKKGVFDPSKFDDRYEAALAELVQAKAEGRPLPERQQKKPEPVVDLLEALRQSAAAGSPRRRAKTRTVAPRRKAG